MARFEDTPGLFGKTVGHSTDGEIICEWCGKTYNKGIGDDGPGGDSIYTDDLGNLQILDCCFEKVENAILQNMHLILPWYVRILKSKEKRINWFKKLISQIKKFG